MKTINADENQEETTNTVEPKLDADLHEFSFEGRKFFVRLNQFNGVRCLQGYLKKLCHEGSMFFKQSFEMRFCSMDMTEMAFKYAKSPKEEFSLIDMEELVSCNFEDPKRTKPLKVKKEQQSDLRYLLYLIGRKRTYVLSANTRSDQVMWFNGFQVFFKVKHVINLVKNGAAFSKQSLQMLEEARQKEALRSKSVPPARKKEANMLVKSKPQRDEDGKRLPTTNITLKGKLGAATDRDKSQPPATKKYYAGQSTKQETNLKTANGEVITRRGDQFQKQQVIPSFSIDKFVEKEEEKKKTEIEKEQSARNNDEEGETKEDPEKNKRINRAQKILQANFLKAAQMDDPKERESAMSRLFSLQAQVNKGLSLEIVDSLTDDLPYEVQSPNQALSKAKEKAAVKQKINETQLELAKVAEQRKKQQEELEQAKKQIEEIKRQQSMKSAQGFTKSAQKVEEDSEYDFEYDSEVEETHTQKKDVKNEKANQMQTRQVFYPEPTSVLKPKQGIKTDTMPSKSSIEPFKMSPSKPTNDYGSNISLGVKQAATFTKSIEVTSPSITYTNPQRVSAYVAAVQQHKPVEPKKIQTSSTKEKKQSIVDQQKYDNNVQTFDPISPFSNPSQNSKLPETPQIQLKPSNQTGQAQQTQQMQQPPFKQASIVLLSASKPQQHTLKQNSQIKADRYYSAAAEQKNTTNYNRNDDQIVTQKAGNSLQETDNNLNNQVVDMLESLQTIQVDDDFDDYKQINNEPETHNDPHVPYDNEDQSSLVQNLSSPNAQQKVQDQKEQFLLEVPSPANRYKKDNAIVSLEQPSLSSSMSRTNNGCYQGKQIWVPDLKDIAHEGSNENDDGADVENDFDLEDSMPNFIIKPFEQSIEQVQADGQTAINEFKVADFEIEEKNDDIDQIEPIQQKQLQQPEESEQIERVSVPVHVAETRVIPTEEKKVQLKTAQPVQSDYNDAVRTPEQHRIHSAWAVTDPETSSSSSRRRPKLQVQKERKVQIEIEQTKNVVEQKPKEDQRPEMIAEAQPTEKKELAATQPAQVSKREKKFSSGGKIQIHNLIQTAQQTSTQPQVKAVKSSIQQNQDEPVPVETHQKRPEENINIVQKIPQQEPKSNYEKQTNKDDSLVEQKSIKVEKPEYQGSDPRQESPQVQQQRALNQADKQPEQITTNHEESSSNGSEQKPRETPENSKTKKIRQISYKKQAPKKQLELSNHQIQPDVVDAYNDQPEQQSPILEKSLGNMFTQYSDNNNQRQKNLWMPRSSRNDDFQSQMHGLISVGGVAADTQNATNVSNRGVQMTQKQIQKKRRLHITRQSNPQENSVLDKSNISHSNHNVTQLNVSNYGVPTTVSNANDQSVGQIELSQEYLNARRMMKKNQINLVNSNASQRSSQRILKVVNIIGSNREGNTSAKRVSNIRARHYKSKGEKIAFKHTGSREQLLSSQELVRASGFTQVKLGPIETGDYDNDVFGGGRQSVLTANDQGIVSSQMRKKNLLMFSGQKGANVTYKNRNTTSNSFYPSAQPDTSNLNILLDEMDKKSKVSDENPFSMHSNDSPKEVHQEEQEEEMRNSGLPRPVLVAREQGSNFSIFPKDNETPVNTNSLQMQKRESVSKTNEIFKRTSQSFHTNDVISPSHGDGSLNQSVAYGVRDTSTMNFDEVVNQQRDPYVLEKMQQHHKLSMHRKNSRDRQSIESQKRSQREESIKAQREIRKKLALQQEEESKMQRVAGIGLSQGTNFRNHRRIPSSTTAPGQGRPPSNLAIQNQKNRLLEAQGSELSPVALRKNVGLSDMFQNQRPTTQQAFNSQAHKPIIDFHRAASGQSSLAAQKKEDDCDADSHFSEEW